MRAPEYGTLTANSDLVAIVHIQRIRPLGAEEEALMERLLSDPPMNVPFRYPTTSAEFSNVRVLKGTRPEQSLIQNGATNCDVYFLEGKDYVVFAQSPGESSELVPAYGTFPLDDSPQSLTALAEVESSLTSPNPTRP